MAETTITYDTPGPYNFSKKSTVLMLKHIKKLCNIVTIENLRLYIFFTSIPASFLKIFDDFIGWRKNNALENYRNHFNYFYKHFSYLMIHCSSETT